MTGSQTLRPVVIRYATGHAVCHSIICGLPESKNTSVYDNIGPVIPAVSTLTLIYWMGSHMQVGRFVHFSSLFFL